MMKRTNLLLISQVLLLALSGCTPNEPPIQLSDVWARPADIDGNSAVYFTIRSRRVADTLLMATCPIADRVQIHFSRVYEDGTVRMEQRDLVDLPAGTWIYFLPGGLHIMLEGLDTPLAQGDTFPLTLHFENSEDLTIDVPVRNQ